MSSEKTHTQQLAPKKQTNKNIQYVYTSIQKYKVTLGFVAIFIK